MRRRLPKNWADVRFSQWGSRVTGRPCECVVPPPLHDTEEMKREALGLVSQHRTHHMTLTNRPFVQIVSGAKVIESRLFDEKRRLISVGDVIVFSHHEDRQRIVKVCVTELYRFSFFSELFSAFEPRLFGGSSREELQTEIETFYSVEQQKRYGVLGIKIEKL